MIDTASLAILLVAIGGFVTTIQVILVSRRVARLEDAPKNPRVSTKIWGL